VCPKYVVVPIEEHGIGPSLGAHDGLRHQRSPSTAVHLSDHRSWLEELAELGYTDAWSGPKRTGRTRSRRWRWAAAWSLAASSAPHRPDFQTGARPCCAEAAGPGRRGPRSFVLGVGTSSDVIVDAGTASPFEAPYPGAPGHVASCGPPSRREGRRDLRHIPGAGLPAWPAPAVVPDPGRRPAAGMLAWPAGSDGAVIKWLDRSTSPKCGRGWAGQGDRGPHLRLPSEDRDLVLQVGRCMVAAYLNVPVSPPSRVVGARASARDMWAAWKAGDRKAALAAILSRWWMTSPVGVAGQVRSRSRRT